MKQARILQAVAILAVVVVISSCRSSRDYRSYPPPPPRTSVSLILNAGPGIAVSRYHDGRYYYRNSYGQMYWRGYDNRYYLDRRYVRKTHYGHNQYNDWKRYHRRRR